MDWQREHSSQWLLRSDSIWKWLSQGKEKADPKTPLEKWHIFFLLTFRWQSKSDDMTDFSHVGRKYIPPTGLEGELGSLWMTLKPVTVVTTVLTGNTIRKEREGLYPEALFAKQTTFTFMFLWTVFFIFYFFNWVDGWGNIKGEVLEVTSYLIVPFVCFFRKYI